MALEYNLEIFKYLATYAKFATIIPYVIITKL